MPEKGIQNNRFNRRKALQIIGAASLGGFGASTSATASQYRPRVVRIEGSYKSPVKSSESREALKRLVNKSPNADPSILNLEATSEFKEGYETVEYVARVGPNGRISQYYGASSEAEESAAHDKGREKVEEFKTSEVTTASTPPVESGPDWNYIEGDFTANATGHFGEMNHNLEWFRVRNSSTERNAFRSIIGTSDDTIIPYERMIKARHDWGESELGDEDLYNAGPDTTHDSGYTVSIGYPSGGSLSWEAGGTGDVTQEYTNDGPQVDWEYEIGTSGSYWFYPGSHVTANKSECGTDQKVITARAEAVWGSYVYFHLHRWHMTTKTC